MDLFQQRPSTGSGHTGSVPFFSLFYIHQFVLKFISKIDAKIKVAKLFLEHNLAPDIVLIILMH